MAIVAKTMWEDTMRFLFAAAVSVAIAAGAWGQSCDQPAGVCFHETAGGFALIASGLPAAVFVDPEADSAVRYAADSFAADLERVSGRKAVRPSAIKTLKGPVVVIGELGRSPTIDGLVRAGKISVADIAGQWEAYRQIVVDRPWANVPRALVIVGSDRRGAAFGAYDFSEKIGVSPFYWFADVAPERRADVTVAAGSHRDQPKVRYRGIFINDEAPAFSTWSQKTFGGANSKMYAHVFELILRLKGNYLWPAMWSPRAFAADDPQNMVLADAMGVVMGTSHHEPMMRAYEEWHRNTDKGITGGKWDYTVNRDNLRTYWRGGIERMMGKPGGYESVVTVGMRGDGDEPMAEGTATQLLQTIVADQRKIIADVTGKPAEKTPQMWALYKEVQDYYDHGMQVPDDVILLFCDDNWGQNRRLPPVGDARKGGYGIYYHFDYVGAPRNYKWINTNQIEKVWQQMDLAYAGGARALWVVNVGDIKPMEYPIAFFMRQAWDPEAMDVAALKAFPAAWARETFGPVAATAVGDILSRYGKMVARRKPELIDAASFRLGAASRKTLDGGEFGSMVDEWQALEADTVKARDLVPADRRDAYFEIVEHPVSAMANLYRLYYAVAWNRRLAAVSDGRANGFADQAEAAFRRDQVLSDRYEAVAGGKWGGMMLQTHIGYTSWQEPKTQVMPEVRRVAAKASPIVFSSAVKPVDGVSAIEAPNFSRAFSGKGVAWVAVPNLGRTLGAVVSLPQNAPSTTEADGIRLEYDVTLAKAGPLSVSLILVPTIDTRAQGGLRIGVSLDDGPVQMVTENLIPTPGEGQTPEQRAWIEAVCDNAYTASATFGAVKAGQHTFKLWRIDGNVVVQKLIVATTDVPASYLGPAAAKMP